jgi:hypothetical protein
VFTARYVLPTQCIYVLCVDLRTNNENFLMKIVVQFRQHIAEFFLNDTLSHKSYTQNLLSVLLFANRVVYQIMWKNMVEPERPQMPLQYSACALYAE